MDEGPSIEEALLREILRKLKLGTEADTEGDREIVCEEVFCDITGVLDLEAQEKLHVARPACFYEVLAPYLCQKSSAAETLLYLLRRQWGQAYATPIYTLLLHRWLFWKNDAGGLEQRQKHINVLMLGASQLFLGDVQSVTARFESLFSYFAFDVAFSLEKDTLDSLPASARSKFLTVVAAFLPYYCSSNDLPDLLATFPSPLQTLNDGLHQEYEGVDFALSEITETIRKIKTEGGLLKYLGALQSLRGKAYIKQLRTVTQLRLQSELYCLSTHGGPLYPPRTVQKAANQVLENLFPLGKTSRRIVRFFFKFLHPTDWIGEFWLYPVQISAKFYATVIANTAFRLYSFLQRFTSADTLHEN